MKEKLLILDDELLILSSLENLFEDDYEVFTAFDADTALRLAAQHDLAVILCDERMPGVSGHEYLARVRSVSRATRVMMSGYVDMSALTEAVNCGQIFAYIAKPWEPLKLKATVAGAARHFKVVQEVDQERALLRALMENIPDHIYFKDCQSRFTRVNQAQAESLGVKDSSECIGKSDDDYFAAEHALRWGEEEQEIMRSGQPQVDRVEQFSKAPGCASWRSTTKVPMFDHAGQVSGIAGISRDITALKNTEEMLREEGERSRMIIETAHDAFIGMDSDGLITAWNPQAELTFGWTAAQMMGHFIGDSVAPDAHQAYVKGIDHFLLAEDGALLSRPIELTALHRDGHEFPVEITLWPVRMAGICSYNAFVRDISDRRQAEQARAKESTLIQLLQSVTMAANRSSTIEHTAQTCIGLICQYTGWQIGHVYLRVGDSSEDLVSTGIWHMDDGARFTAFREASLGCRFAGGTGLPGSVLATGKPQWIVNLGAEEPRSERTTAAVDAGLRSGFGFPLLVKDQIIGVLEFFSLQTVQPDAEFLTMVGHIDSQLGQVIIRQRVEADLQRAKTQAETANRAKSEFLTTMSHEMRTPMNAILGMADLLSESSLSQEQLDYVHIFQKAGANLLDLINDILDLSKVESGYFQLESIGFNLHAVLEKVIQMMASRAHDRGLHLNLEIPPGIPAGVIGDPNRLRQILINLVGNALKFTQQGSVTLRVESEAAKGEGWLRFSVTDTGIGIAADKTELIFERFTQADSSTTRNYGGTGLGLAISKGLVELMGGRLGCTSKIGTGSTFFLVVPFGSYIVTEVAEVSEQAPIALSPELFVGPRKPIRILLAEDSDNNVMLIRAYLKDSRFQLEVVANGKLALDKVIAGDLDLVLMDIQMPVMDGLDATRAIREWEAKELAPSIPILALTAEASSEGIASSKRAGCTEHLTKPIKKAVLLEAIFRHVCGSIRITPPEGIEALIPTYLANVRRDIGKILASAESKDCDIARRLGHQFKGSGEGYGFSEITRVGAALELAAMADNEAEVKRQTLALATYLDRVEIVVGVG